MIGYIPHTCTVNFEINHNDEDTNKNKINNTIIYDKTIQNDELGREQPYVAKNKERQRSYYSYDPFRCYRCPKLNIAGTTQ